MVSLGTQPANRKSGFGHSSPTGARAQDLSRQPARPDLWGARVSNDPGLPDLGWTPPPVRISPKTRVYRGSRSWIRWDAVRRQPSTGSVRLRASCSIHAPYGCGWIPAMVTRRVSRSITKKTRYRLRPASVSTATVNRSQAARPSQCACKNAFHGVRLARSGGPAESPEPPSPSILPSPWGPPPLAGKCCTASGFLDSGLTVFASTPPRPARGGRVAPGPGFGSRTSPASSARCTSA